MKTLTRKQREKIYRKAAERMLKFGARTFGCECIGKCTGKRNYSLAEKDDFPEFFMFKNKYPSKKYAPLWWDWTTENVQVRVLALLLSAEMTKTEKL